MTSPVHTNEPLVIGLDSSTQSTKAIAWNRNGEVVAEGRADISMSHPQADYFEQDPVDWWTSSVAAISDCIANIAPQQVQALAISNQRETLGFMDENGASTYPAIVWLDERARSQVASFSKHFGADKIHRITGRPADLTPCLYRFLWMKENEPQVYSRTRCFVDVQAYLVQRLCDGPYRTGWISADPMGIFNLTQSKWSTELLQELSLDVSRLPEALPPGSLLGRVTASAAAKTGLPTETPVFAAGGDGQCAGLGTNCTIPDRAYINLGTAVVSGIWSSKYRYSSAWRTMLAAQGEGYIYENCLRTGAFLIDWFVDQFVAQGKADEAVFKQLETAAQLLPIGSDGLLVQPYFSGVMDPHWDTSARGVILGLSGSHTPTHIYRAIIESITIDQVMRTQEMEAAAEQNISHFVAIGGGANSIFWRQMLADASGKPVHVSSTIEASALGAGMIAAYGAGWFDSITDAAQQMAGDTTPVLPDAAKHAAYQSLLDIYRNLYHATASLNQQMVAFAAEQRQALT